MSDRYFKRQFLNPDEGIAAIQAKIGDPESWGFEAMLTISDCHRTVDLEFVANHADVVVRRQKAKRLRAAVNDFVAVYLEALSEIEPSDG